MKKRLGLLLFVLAVLMSGCAETDIVENSSISAREWDLLVESAENTDVTLYYAQSDETLDMWLTREVVPSVREAYGIDLKPVRKEMAEVQEILLEHKLNEVEGGPVDMIYIQDDAFKNMMQSGLLYGPFLEKLPNYHANVNPEDYEFAYEEGIPTGGYYLPVSRTQLAFVYDEDLLLDPPQTMDDFIQTLRTAPGQFSFPLPPDPAGTLFMETFIGTYTDYEALFETEATRGAIAPLIQPALDQLQVLRPKLWRSGNEFPVSEQALDQLFYDGQVSFALTTDPNKASAYAKAEAYPYAARAFVMDGGTAGNNEGVVIAHNAANKSGAIVVANHMLSAQAQAYKYEPANGGSIPVVDTSIMPDEEARIVTRVSVKRSDIKQDELNTRRIPPMPEDVREVVTILWLEALSEPIVE